MGACGYLPLSSLPRPVKSVRGAAPAASTGGARAGAGGAPGMEGRPGLERATSVQPQRVSVSKSMFGDFTWECLHRRNRLVYAWRAHGPTLPSTLPCACACLCLCTLGNVCTSLRVTEKSGMWF